MIELEVSAVVLCPGYDMADRIPPAFGYEGNPDVITSMEYERILSASGPFAGHVRRPSDARAPERIAFIQCVGSRDHGCGADYCSAVCACMPSSRRRLRGSICRALRISISITWICAPMGRILSAMWKTGRKNMGFV